MLKFNSRRANLSFLFGLVLLVLVAFVVIKARPENISWLDNEYVGNTTIATAQAQSYLAKEQPQDQDGDLVLGNKKADLKLYVFEDYSSPFSAVLADNLDKLLVEFGDDLAIVIRPYVKNSDLAQQSALAISCAAEQDKWRELRALFFAKVKNQQVLDPVAAENLDQVGIQTDNFSACLTNIQKSEKIEQAEVAAESLQVYGAPTIFIGEELIPGARPYDDYTDANGEVVAGLKTLVARKIAK